MDSLNLLPCPFCGAKARLEGDEYGWVFVSCQNVDCEATIGSSWSAEEVAKTWNTRIELVEALYLLNKAVEIMTEDQLSQWRGIRSFLETAPELSKK